MGGRMLALKEAFGYRPLLVVKNITFVSQLNERPPSTFLYGDQVMFLADRPTDYASFLRNFYGQPETIWCQLADAHEESLDIVYALFPRKAFHLVLEQPLVLLSAGKDPLAGYYVQFAGDIRLFAQRDWWVETEEDQERYRMQPPPAPRKAAIDPSWNAMVQGSRLTTPAPPTPTSTVAINGVSLAAGLAVLGFDLSGGIMVNGVPLATPTPTTSVSINGLSLGTGISVNGSFVSTDFTVLGGGLV